MPEYKVIIINPAWEEQSNRQINAAAKEGWTFCSATSFSNGIMVFLEKKDTPATGRGVKKAHANPES